MQQATVRQIVQEIRQDTILRVLNQSSGIKLAILKKNEDRTFSQYTMTANQQACQVAHQKLLIQDLNYFFQKYFITKSSKYYVDLQNYTIKFNYQLLLNKSKKDLQLQLKFDKTQQNQNLHARLFDEYFSLKQKILKAKLAVKQKHLKFYQSIDNWHFLLQKSDIDSFSTHATCNNNINYTFTKIKQSKNQWSQLWFKVKRIRQKQIQPFSNYRQDSFGNNIYPGNVNQKEGKSLFQFKFQLMKTQRVIKIKNLQENISKRIYLKLIFANGKQVQFFNDCEVRYSSQNSVIQSSKSNNIHIFVVAVNLTSVRINSRFHLNEEERKRHEKQLQTQQFETQEDFQICLGVKNQSEIVSFTYQ